MGEKTYGYLKNCSRRRGWGVKMGLCHQSLLEFFFFLKWVWVDPSCVVTFFLFSFGFWFGNIWCLVFGLRWFCVLVWGIWGWFLLVWCDTYKDVVMVFGFGFGAIYGVWVFGVWLGAVSWCWWWLFLPLFPSLMAREWRTDKRKQLRWEKWDCEMRERE